MTYLLITLRAEALKVRKSRVIWLTALAFSIAPLMAGFFMFVLKNPAYAESAGLLGAKAQIAGEASWPSYLQIHAQMIAVGGLIVFGFVTSWLFGREYADATAKDLLALPYSRTFVVFAKFILAFLIHIALSLYIIGLGFILGWCIGLPEWSPEIMLSHFYVLLIVTVMTAILCTPVAFFAFYGKGYLAPLGFVILTLVFSQIMTAAGFGDYFPWAIPAIYSGLTDGIGTLSWQAISIVLLTSLLGILGTLYCWLYMDQH